MGEYVIIGSVPVSCVSGNEMPKKIKLREQSRMEISKKVIWETVATSSVAETSSSNVINTNFEQKEKAYNLIFNDYSLSYQNQGYKPIKINSLVLANIVGNYYSKYVVTETVEKEEKIDENIAINNIEETYTASEGLIPIVPITEQIPVEEVSTSTEISEEPVAVEEVVVPVEIETPEEPAPIEERTIPVVAPIVDRNYPEAPKEEMTMEVETPATIITDSSAEQEKKEESKDETDVNSQISEILQKFAKLKEEESIAETMKKEAEAEAANSSIKKEELLAKSKEAIELLESKIANIKGEIQHYNDEAENNKKQSAALSEMIDSYTL